MTTKEDAAEMLCPIRKSGFDGGAAWCISEGCMMWRWLPAKEYTAAIREPKEKPTDGYCGLAGRP